MQSEDNLDISHKLLTCHRFTTFLIFFFLIRGPPPRSPLFPYTTLFRSLAFLRDPAEAKARTAMGGELGDVLASPENLSSLQAGIERQSTRLNSSHGSISYAVLCL